MTINEFIYSNNYCNCTIMLKYRQGKVIFYMNMNYSIDLKKKLCKEICFNHASTLKTIEEYS